MPGSRYENASLARFMGTEEEKGKILGWLTDPKLLLLMSGGVGTGKTYFCAAVWNYLVDTQDYPEMYYLTGRRFAAESREEIGNKGTGYGVVDKYKDYQYLFFDDLGAGNVTDWQKEIIQELLDFRYSLKKKTIVTTNLDERAMEEFDFRLRDRLYSSGNTKIHRSGPSKRQYENNEGEVCV